MENIQIRRNIMRDAHLVICAAIFADGTKPPVSVVDYTYEKHDGYQMISTNRHIFVKTNHRVFALENKAILLDGIRYTFKDTVSSSLQQSTSFVVIPQNGSDMKFTIEKGTQVYNRINDMFMEVFHGTV